MTTVTRIQRDYKALKFCPVCGKELEASPQSGLKTCFVHGDFDCHERRIVWDTAQYQPAVRSSGEYPPTGSRRHA